MDQQRRLRSRSSIAKGVNTDAYRNKHEYFYAEYGLEILAYLQYTIGEERPLQFFEANVVSHCRDRFQKSVSASEVKSKLRLFWSHWHPPDCKSSEWKKLYHLGLEGLPRLEEEKAKWVRERARSLKDLVGAKGTVRLLRSALNVPSTPRRTPKKRSTRSNGKLSGSQPRKRQRHADSPTPRQKNKRRLNSASVRSSTAQQSVTPCISLMPQTAATSEIPDSQEITSPIGSTRSTFPPVFDQIALKNITQGHSEAILELEVLENQVTQLTTEREELRNQQSQLASELEDSKYKESMLMWELEDLQAQKADETHYWKGLYLQTRKSQKGLKRQNKQMQVELAKSGQSAVGNNEVKLRSQIDELNHKIASYRAISMFKAPFREDSEAQNERKVVEDLDRLISKLHKVLQGQDVLFSIEKLGISEHPDLVTLLRRSLKLEIDDTSGCTISTTKLCGSSLQALVLSLISAALCAWVFETDVGALFQENSHTYSKLQGLLAAQDKELTDSFEFAAHREVIDDEFICDLLIPRRARYLARRVLTCVLPLLEAHRSLDDQYADITAEWSEEGHQLTEIFKLALYAKVRLLLTTNSYRCDIPMPGTGFDSGTMGKRLDGDFYCLASRPDEVVRVTIFPCFLRYTTRKEGFSYNRFLTEERIPKKIEPDVLMRAVVVTR